MTTTLWGKLPERIYCARSREIEFFFQKSKIYT